MAFCLSFLVFFSCGAPPLWVEQEIDASKKRHRAEVMSYYPVNPFSKMNVRIYEGEYGTRFAVRLLSRPVTTGTLIISANGESRRVAGQIMEGGQVVVLPKEEGTRYAALLRSGSKLEIRLAGYHEIIPPLDM